MTRITTVRTRTAPFSSGTWLDEVRVSTPMAPFPEHAERRSTWRGPGADVVWTHVATADPEVFGIGQARGGAVVESLVQEHLVPLLSTLDPTAPVHAAAVLRRAVAPYAEGGVAEMAVSAVELALWDLSARAAGLPLFRLLGGTADALPYYLTTPAPELLDRPEVAHMLPGARCVKVPMAYGPHDGPARMRDNLARLAAVRERVPAGIPLAVDCFMSWDLPYTLRFVAAARDLDLAWVEEPLNPGDVAGHRELRARLGPVALAAGEHAFGLRAGRALVEQRAVDVLQSDVTWCGGLDVARTLGALAQDAGVLFAPHASAMQPWAVHLLAATGPGAVAEVLLGLEDGVQVPRPGDGPGVGIRPEEVGL
ncbi:enolase C-terminal domain-like protein [Actinotalea subterranea]|uniref:enolase C-terminal domain-like protein n=1 Tax=Actinotalea subterranea TaxID=2607497 RepID=UPI0011EDD9DC|nr:enolase C-terminal domain-like protein [Actinotalea subterranea]